MPLQRSRFLTCLNREIHFVEFLPDSVGCAAANGVDDEATATAIAKLSVILCIHGLTRTWMDFETLGRYASATGPQGFRVISIDVLGRGLSQWSPEPEKEYGMRFYVPLVQDLLRQLGITKLAAAIGQSMGGILFWNLCTVAPSLVERLILIDVGPELNMAGLVRIGQYTNAANDAATFQELVALYKSRFSTFSPMPDEQLLLRFVQNHARRLQNGRWALHCDPAAPANLKNDCMDIVDPKTLWTAFSQVECPIFVVRGAESDLLVQDGVDKMRENAKKAPHFECVEIAGCGHVPLLQVQSEIDVVMKMVRWMKAE